MQLSTLERDRRARQRKSSHTSLAEQRRRAAQREASEAIPREQRVRDRVMRMSEMVETSGLSRWTIKRAADRGELQLIKLTAKGIGARESVFWRWVDSKRIP